MSEERPISACDFCPQCGTDCCTCNKDKFFPPKKFFPKCHKDFAKCNLCNCIQRDDAVTIGTTAGFTIAGTVAEILCDCTVLRLSPGAEILAPCATDIIGVTTQPTFICCDDIEYIVKQDIDLTPVNGG